MAGCDAHTYNGVTEEIFACFKKNALARDVEWHGDNTGTFKGCQMGQCVVTSYTYDPAAQTLTLQITDKPFIVSCDYVYGQLHGGLEACGGTQLLRF